MEERTQPPRTIRLGLALVSLGMLALQLSLTRVFSLLVWYHFAFLAIALALLGFTGGGIVVQVRPSLLSGDVPARLSKVAYGAAISAVVALFVSARLPFGSSVLDSPGQLSLFALLVVLLLVPFVLAGVLVAATLSAHPRAIARLYFADLLGSGLGCVVTLFVLDRLGGGAGGVLFAATIFALAGLAYARASSAAKMTQGIVVALASAALLLLARNPLADPFYLPNAKLYPRVPRELIVARRCSSLACVDFFHNPLHWGMWGISQKYKGPLPRQVGVVIDAWAITSILEAEKGADGRPILYHPALEALPGSVPHHFNRVTGRRDADVLVIGAGGGLDIRTALAFGARHVDAVDINPMIVHAVHDDWNDFSGGLYRRPDVKVAVAEGRHFMRRADKKWDLIQISGVDTYAASQAGAFALHENYLYTVEAMREALSHLTDDGTLSLTRWLYKPPRQTLRLAVILDRAMKDLGMPGAERRLVILAAPVSDSSMDFSIVLARRTEFTEKEIESLLRIGDAMGFYPVYAPGRALNNPFHAYFAASDKQAFVRDYPFRIDPTTDDAPFFFEHNRFARLFGSRDAIFGAASGPLVLLVTLVIVVALAIAFALLPRWLRVPTAPMPARAQVYFVALGLAYIGVELWFVPRFVLYLGHPSHALSVVLFSMLTASGLGSALSPRWVKTTRAVSIVALCIVALLAVEWLALPKIFDATLNLVFPGRVALAVLLVAAPALLMGMPFPSGLSLTARSEGFVARAWVLNGVASVIASVGATLVAIGNGFGAVLGLAALCYVVAAFAVRGADSTASA